jgi:hypothetical protein
MRIKSQKKPPQRILKEKFLDLQTSLDQRLSRSTQLEFALAVFASWTVSLVARDLDNPVWLIPSHFFWADCVRLYLHWLLYYWDLKRYSIFGVAETPMRKILNWVKAHRPLFIEKLLKPRPCSVRRAASLKNFPPDYDGITIIVDGRHSLIRFVKSFAAVAYSKIDDASGLVELDYYSFKLKKSCLNTQMAVAADDYIEWVSDTSLPCSRWNDITQMKKHIESFKNILEEGDAVCFDGGYQSIDRYLDVPVCLPHRKPAGQDLTLDQLQENATIAEFRGNVERVFAALVKKFNFLGEIYRHGDFNFNGDFKTAAALFNCCLIEKDLSQENLQEIHRHPLFSFDMFFLDELGKIQAAIEHSIEVPISTLHGKKFSASQNKGL